MRTPSEIAILAECHAALAGADQVADHHPLDSASYLLGVAAALTWVRDVEYERPIAKLHRIVSPA